MKHDPEFWFAAACKEPFAFLIKEYGFSGPVQTRGGNEFTVSYKKGKRTVCISIEPFSAPIIELFYPSTDLKHRRIPRQTRLPSKNTPLSSEDELARALRHAATELTNNEREFLTAI